MVCMRVKYLPPPIYPLRVPAGVALSSTMNKHSDALPTETPAKHSFLPESTIFIDDVSDIAWSNHGVWSEFNFSYFSELKTA